MNRIRTIDQKRYAKIARYKRRREKLNMQRQRQVSYWNSKERQELLLMLQEQDAFFVQDVIEKSVMDQLQVSDEEDLLGRHHLPVKDVNVLTVSSDKLTGEVASALICCNGL